ncbi:MAG: methionyl-tRNA formyltransferase [Candidatus Marinimicrobia bacterium]|nr:methionyl-tRNA formyltransferase [Candidatus Neomarinimicrobiota bacterium]
MSNPSKPTGRKKTEKITKVGEFAKSQNIPLLQPQTLDDPKFLEEINTFNPDYFLVVAFKILPDSLLNIPQKGSINLHASLLPHYRGAAPIQRAIMNGERETGLTTFIIRRLVDTGSILMRVKVPINDSDTYGTLSEKMSKKGAYLLLETLNRLKDNSLSPQEQEHSIATSAPKIKEGDSRIDWAQPAEIIHNQIRGLAPIPGAFTYWKGMRFKILRSRINQSNEKKNPGSVAYCDKKQLIIQAGYGQIKLLTMQREGKKIMETPDFLNGVDVIIGDTFGD